MENYRKQVCRMAVWTMLILSGFGPGLNAQTDTTKPSITQVSIKGSPGKKDTEVIYRVSFSEPVDSVNIDDFRTDLVAGFAEGTITMAQQDSSVNTDYLIAVQVEGSLYNKDKDQQLRLGLSEDHNIHDLAGNKLENFDNSTVPTHTTSLSYFDHPGTFRLLLEEDDMPSSSPIQLNVGTVGLLVPALAIAYPRDQKLLFEIKLDSFFWMQPYYTGNENHAWKTDYSLSIYGPDFIDPEKQTKALELTGQVELVGGIDFTSTAEGGAGSLQFSEEYGLVFSSINFSETAVTHSEIGGINTFLIEFRLNLAAIGLVSMLNGQISDLRFPALPFYLSEIGFHEAHPDSIKYMEFYDGGIGNIVVGAGSLGASENSQGFLEGFLTRKDAESPAFSSRTAARLTNEFYPNNFITTNEDGYFVVDNPDMISKMTNGEDSNTDNKNSYTIGIYFNGSDVGLSEHETMDIPARPEGAEAYSLQRFTENGTFNRNRVEEWAYGFPTKGRDNSIFLLADSLNLSENLSSVADIGAHAGGLETFEESDSYAITGGDDMALFEIDASTGQLDFKAAPDFENPLDADKDNEYLVEITADRSANFGDSDVLKLVVAVTDIDEIAPTLNITSDAGTPHSGGFTATFTFSEPVMGFDLSDISVVNAEADNFNATSTSVYTASITPVADGEVTIDVGAGLAADAAGNTNEAAAQLQVTNDETAPTLTITSNTAESHNGAFTATFTFSEAVTGFALDGIAVGNGSASDFMETSSTVYTALIRPTAEGELTINVSANKANDAAGNGNLAATQFMVAIDMTVPTLTITSNANDPQSGPFSATFTFSEPITGFETEDLNLVNATAGDIVSTSESIFTALITPAADGTVTVGLAAEKVSDIAGNGNEATTSISVTNDETAPEATAITRLNDNPVPTGTSELSFTLSLSEPVNGLTVDDLQIDLTGTAAASLGHITSVDAANYQVTLTGVAGEGTIALTTKTGGPLADAAGNGLASGFSDEIYTTNFLPTDITLSAESILENNAEGDLVATISTTDADASDTHTYSLVAGTGDTDNGAFTINGDQLLAQVSFDRETKASYDIRILTDDGNGGTYQEALTIIIDNVPEAALRITGDGNVPGPTPLGLTTDFDVTVYNDGDAALNIISVLYPPAFGGPVLGIIVPPASSQVVTMNFKPTAAQVYTGNIVVITNGGTGTFPVTATGAIVTNIDNGLINPESVAVFPNPVSQKLTIDLRVFNGKPVDITLVDMNGSIARQIEGYEESEITLNVSGYRQGLYLINLTDGTSLVQKKVLIQH